MSEVLGKVVLLEVDVANGTSYKTLICMQDFELEVATAIDTQESDCGQFNVPGTPGATISFNAVCDTSPSVSQLSYEDVLSAVNAATVCSFRVQSPTLTGSTAGAVFYHGFSGYFSRVRLIKQTAGAIRFSGEIVSSGAIDLTA